ncbi:lytic transglycosylase domain-containing protein [Alloactinosynnema sp. L-07]|uniref:lytic transglycosylase domain-containing protein n=1 Tax=Alloactinosynnema sp. L-07 TaxID=1653480 RepID=UPI000A3DB47A|nr:lytic murein transglycosylase [Alloactinosynnema sp. L-07]
MIFFPRSGTVVLPSTHSEVIMARHRKPVPPKRRRPHRISGIATAATPLAILLAMVTSDGTGNPGVGPSGALTPTGPFPADNEIAVNGALPGPPLTAPVTPVDPIAALPAGGAGIPEMVLRAYIRAETLLAGTQPDCHVTWSLLAGIGRIESGHARDGALREDGTTVSRIIGPALNGDGFASIKDTDNGRYDGDTTWDRAVGPMQFIPATWTRYGADATDDGTADPHNIYDATASAARYLCAGGGDLRNPQDAASAVFRYNHSQKYVSDVLTWAATYATGVTAIPVDPAKVVPDSPGSEVLALPAPVAHTPNAVAPNSEHAAPTHPRGTALGQSIRPR